MATVEHAVKETLVAPWEEWARREIKGRRLLEAGTYALTEGAIAAGCRVFAGYPITPATDIAEYMSERFRTPVTILTDQVISDMWEDLFIPDDYDGLDFVIPRKHNLMMPFYPVGSADLDVPPNVIGHGTGVCVSAYTHTEEGYDIEEMEAQWAQTFRLVNKIRHHRVDLTRYETLGVDDAEVIAVAYGANARTVKTGVLEARRRGVRAGFVRLITLWPFPDELFERDARYVVCELNYDGQLVREVMRSAPDKRKVHFMGKSAELHTVAEVVAGREGPARRATIPELRYIWTEVR